MWPDAQDHPACRDRRRVAMPPGTRPAGGRRTRMPLNDGIDAATGGAARGRAIWTYVSARRRACRIPARS